jgi:hypothetical protein
VIRDAATEQLERLSITSLCLLDCLLWTCVNHRSCQPWASSFCVYFTWIVCWRHHVVHGTGSIISSKKIENELKGWENGISTIRWGKSDEKRCLFCLRSSDQWKLFWWTHEMRYGRNIMYLRLNLFLFVTDVVSGVDGDD